MPSAMLSLRIQLTRELAQIRNTIASALFVIARNKWRPSYPSVSALLASCGETQDALCTQ
jgi:proteasome activator subunit 4